jgi:predicted TIM-barrel fold metal-dependent hydrolase
MVFGSAFPMMPVDTAVAEVDGLDLSDEVRGLWLHDNAARFLGLDPGNETVR